MASAQVDLTTGEQEERWRKTLRDFPKNDDAQLQIRQILTSPELTLDHKYTRILNLGRRYFKNGPLDPEQVISEETKIFLFNTVLSHDPLAEFPSTSFMSYFLLSSVLYNKVVLIPGNALCECIQTWYPLKIIRGFVGLERLSHCSNVFQAAVHMFFLAQGFYQPTRTDHKWNLIELALANRSYDLRLPRLTKTEMSFVLEHYIVSAYPEVCQACKYDDVGSAYIKVSDGKNIPVDCFKKHLVQDLENGLYADGILSDIPTKVLYDGKLKRLVDADAIQMYDKTADDLYDTVEFAIGLTQKVTELCKLPLGAFRTTMHWNVIQPTVSLLFNDKGACREYFARNQYQIPPRWLNKLPGHNFNVELMQLKVAQKDVHLSFFFYRMKDPALKAKFFSECGTKKELIVPQMLEALKWTAFTVIRANYVSLDDDWKGYVKDSDTTGFEVTSEDLSRAAQNSIDAAIDDETLSPTTNEILLQKLTRETLNVGEGTPDSRLELVATKGGFYGRNGFLPLDLYAKMYPGQQLPDGVDQHSTHFIPHPACAKVVVAFGSQKSTFYTWIPWDEPEHLMFARFCRVTAIDVDQSQEFDFVNVGRKIKSDPVKPERRLYDMVDIVPKKRLEFSITIDYPSPEPLDERVQYITSDELEGPPPKMPRLAYEQFTDEVGGGAAVGQITRDLKTGKASVSLNSFSDLALEPT